MVQDVWRRKSTGRMYELVNAQVPFVTKTPDNGLKMVIFQDLHKQSENFIQQYVASEAFFMQEFERVT